METSNVTPEQEELGKIGKQFESNMKKLTAVLQGESLYKAPKVVGDEDLTKAIVAIAKEEKEEKLKEFVEGVRTLIKDKRAFDKFQKEKKKEFEKAVEDKQKSFNDSANKLFGLMDDIKSIEESYYNTMSGKS